MNRRLALAVMGLALGASVVWAQQVPPICDDGQCIQVGSYNIELLGKDRQPFNGVVRGDRSDAEID